MRRVRVAVDAEEHDRAHEDLFCEGAGVTMGGAMRSFGRLRRFGCAACVDWPFTGIAIEVLQSCGGVSTYARVYLSCYLAPTVHIVPRPTTEEERGRDRDPSR